MRGHERAGYRGLTFAGSSLKSKDSKTPPNVPLVSRCTPSEQVLWFSKEKHEKS